MPNKGVYLKSKVENTKHIWLQHDHPTACVIAQEYFSATFISLCFNYHEEKFGMLLKKFLFFLTFFFKSGISLKFHNL
jgi:hypothetical protein